MLRFTRDVRCYVGPEYKLMNEFADLITDDSGSYKFHYGDSTRKTKWSFRGVIEAISHWEFIVVLLQL